ncbi:unnamed protein product [Lathyrus sativus]|nr:unnamed protein product [Lathyrus sativus]
MKRVSRAIELMHILPQLRDTILSFFYFGLAWVLPIYFCVCLRMYKPNHMEEATIWFDKELGREVEDIVVGSGPFF